MTVTVGAVMNASLLENLLKIDRFCQLESKHEPILENKIPHLETY